MLKLKDYRSRAKGLPDLLPYAALIAPGVILNKDGSFLAAREIRGQDTASSTPDELTFVSAQFNNAIRLLGTGWMLHVDSIRSSHRAYPAPEKGHFLDPVTLLIDDERRAYFSGNRCFSTSTIFSVTYKPNFEAAKLAGKVQAGTATSPVLEKALGQFQNTLEELEDALSSVLHMQRLTEYEAYADDGEAYQQSDLLSHIQHCVSGDLHPLRVPEKAMYLDHLLASNDLVGGVIPPGYPPAIDGIGGVDGGKTPEIDYISPTVVPLTAKEKKALSLSQDWARQNIDPVLSGGGKVMYVHGASLPTIVATPMQVSDVELEAGEIVNEIVVGDSARWMVESGSAGSDPDARVHLFIKPVDAGLETSTVITTNLRVHHLRLVSQRKGHTPYVGFLYADSLNRQSAARQAREAKEQEWSSTTIDGQQADLSKLNFNYEVKGKAAWKPERVYDDGRQTFIRLPEKTASGEMPVLLVRKGSRDVLVNYRVKDAAMVVDGLFERIALIVGVDGDQEKVEVIRGKK